MEKKNFGPVPEDESSIVQRLWRLRKIPISDFTVDDIRFTIVQGVGLKYMLTEAIELLSQNLMTEGNYYEGDLLNAVLKLNKEQWRQVHELWAKVDVLISGKIEHLRTIRPKLEVDNFYKNRPK